MSRPILRLCLWVCTAATAASLQAVEIVGRVTAVDDQTLTMSIEGRYLPTVGNRIVVLTPIPGLNEQALVAQAAVTRVSDDVVLGKIERKTGTVAVGQAVRIDAPEPWIRSPTPPVAPPPSSNASAPPPVPGSLPFTPTRLDWLIVELNAFARIQTLATERFTLMFTPRPTDDTVVIYVRYLPDVDHDDLRGAIREARHVIEIITRRRGWNDWVRVTEDTAAM